MIGIDLVSIARITHMRERFGDKAFAKFLSEEELSLVQNDVTAAGFYAAKEAISKALGIGICGQCGFMDIKILKDVRNAPSFTLSRHLVEAYEISDVSLSITHENGFAVAVAVIEGQKRQRRLWH
ncbi:MAG: holo-ACP synthase [Sulfurospirillum cavolei]|uniref:holo-ACP synthase n=1 Tax=Sulfurospirillum cavolei TaxID=366522 RepID=UPI0005AB02BF|nr:holo-ACP synthase [Sulfurospirillum cavolei]MDY0265973.1 holo-ACP synthase [Sulfurospirillum cavolei]